MAKKVKFGARIPNSGPASSVKNLIQSTLESEELGYDLAFDLDHIHNSHDRHKHYPVGMGSYEEPENTLDPNHFETISLFSFLSGMTKKIEFGVGIMPVLLRNPIVLAKEIATLDSLSNGRFVFGVGVSNVSDRAEFKAVGKKFNKYVDRYEELGEYIGAMKEIWGKPSASFHGKYVNFDDLTIYPKPARAPHPPIWVGCYTLAGAKDRPAVKFALQHADGWIYGFLMTPEIVKSMIIEFTQTAKEAKRDISKFDWCFQMRLSIGSTQDEAAQNCAWIPKLQTSMGRYAGYMWNVKEDWREAKGGVKEAPRSNVETAAVGAPSQIIKRVGEFVDAGATHFDLWFMYPNFESLMRQIRIFAKEVMPSFS